MSQLCVCDALVVVPDRWPGRARLVRSPVTFMTGEPYCRVSELVDGRERRAGVVGLVAERPVELGGVADRTRGWSATGSTGGSPGRSGRPRPTARRASRRAGRAAASSSAVPVVAVADEVLPAAAHRRRDACASSRRRRYFSSVPNASSSGCERGPAAGWSWCPRGRCRTCSPRPAAARRRACSTPGASSSRARPAGQQVDLVGRAAPTSGSIVVGRDPLDVARTSARAPARSAGWSSPRRPAPCGSRSRRPGWRTVWPSTDAGGEPPGAVEDHPDREADVLGVARRPGAARRAPGRPASGSARTGSRRG